MQTFAVGGAGVYVLESDSGMVKIGVSGTVATRVRTLTQQAARAGTSCWLLCCLPDAGMDVERWLHSAFGETRDRSWARAECLPNATEWFWPTPALADLAVGWDFVEKIAPEREEMAA